MKNPSIFTRPELPWKILFVGIAALGLFSMPSQAAVYYLKAGVGSTNWGVASDWNTQVDGLGVNASTMTGNDFFVTSGRTVGTPTGNSTFGGVSLTIDNGGTFSVRNSGTKTISNLAANSGATFTANTTNVLLSATTTISGNTNFNFIAASSTSTFSLGVLSGSGNISLSATGANDVFIVDATSATNYTGTIGWTGSNLPVLQFGSTLTFGGGLVAADATSRINLDQNVTFSSVTLNGMSLDAGTYSYLYLNTNYDTIFVNGGSGSITVVPEPATAVCVVGGIGAFFLARRRNVSKNSMH